jgi:hypothetical protein
MSTLVLICSIQASVSASEQMGSLLIGLEKATSITNRCKVYEGFYRSYIQAGMLGQELENLESGTANLYTAVLKFLSFSIRLFHMGSFGLTSYALLTPGKILTFITEFEYLDNELVKEVDNCKAVSNMN